MKLENVEDVFSLSPIQEGMLFHSVAAPQSGVSIQQVVSTLEGVFDPARFKQVWNELVDKYPALRTAFLWDGLDEPLQVVRRGVETHWREEDWRKPPTDGQENRLARLLAEDRLQDFDLTRAPLSRMVLARETEQHWKWVWTFHHIQCDGWSTHLLLRELWDRYHGRRSSQTSEEIPRYDKYIEWLNAQDQEQAKKFWQDRLAGFNEPTRLNLDSSSQIRSERKTNNQQSLQLSTVLSQQLRDLARQHRLTLNTIFQGAWAALIGKYSQTNDVVFGVTVSGRPPEIQGIEHAVGTFINTLPARVKLTEDLPLIPFLQQLQANAREDRNYEYSSLARVQKWSEIPAGSQLFKTIIVFENYPEPESIEQQQELHIRNVEFYEQSNYPIALLILPKDEIELLLVHDTNLLNVEAAKRLLKHVENILEQFLNPAMQLSSVSITTSEEQETILKLWNHKPPPISNEVLHDLIESQVQARPGATAIAFQDRQLTYADFNQRATDLAVTLRKNGVEVGESVGLCMERSIDLLVGMLAILKSGAAYVPLNPAWPKNHMNFVVKDARVKRVVATNAESELLPASVEFINVSTAQDVAPKQLDRAKVTTSDPAYVIYTSGSTGRPKGVSVSHGNIVASTTARNSFYTEKPERFLLLSAFTFDSSLVGIFWTLCNGGTVVLPEQEGEKDLHQVRSMIQEHNVTHTLCLPSLYQLLLDEASPAELASLQVVIVAGEAFPSKLSQQHFELVPSTKLYNEYGPTETTVWCIAHEVEAGDSRTQVPIGRPISCADAYVLDGNLELLPAGIIGELYVGGRGVADGYLNHSELTAEKFLADPFRDGQRIYRTGDLACYRSDGKLLYFGRADRQLKIRGHRVEPEEIESLLKSHEAIKDAIVRLNPAVVSTKSLVEQLSVLPELRRAELLRQVTRQYDVNIRERDARQDS